MIYLDDTLTLENEKDVENALTKYKCKSVEDLADLLWFHHGVTLIDHSDSSDYTQMNAQSSPEFADEAVTVEEFEELTERRALYPR